MSYESQLIREATEGPSFQEVHEDYCEQGEAETLEATPEATMPRIEMAQQGRQGRHSISPYPPHITVKGNNVFSHGKYVGYVDKVQNWGTDFLARPIKGYDNAFFSTKTEAVLYLAT